MITRLHQVWMGEKKMPECFVTWAETWRREHPGWDFTLWAEHPDIIPRVEPWTAVEALPPLINGHLFKELPELVTNRPMIAAKSDLVRYEIVARYGGIYIDGDVECFQSVRELVDGVRLFCADEYGPTAGNYCFGAEANHPAMWTVVRELQHRFYAAKDLDKKSRKEGSRENRLPVNPVYLCGPNYLNEQLRKHPDLVLFPWPLFNPLSAWDDYKLVRFWPETAYANHHYYGTWYDREKKTPPKEFMSRGDDAA